MIRCDRHTDAEPADKCGACENLRLEYRTLRPGRQDDRSPVFGNPHPGHPAVPPSSPPERLRGGRAREDDPARAWVVGNSIAFELIQHDPSPSRIPAVVREMSDDPRSTQRELVLVEVIVALHTIAREYYRLSRAKSPDEALAMTERIEGVLSERLGWDLEALWGVDR